MEVKAIGLGITEVAKLLHQHYGISGELEQLDGEIDFNFKVRSNNGKNYLLRISRANADTSFHEFVVSLHQHLINKNIPVPKPIFNLSNSCITTFTDGQQSNRTMRLFSWIEGRRWSEVEPITDRLLGELGSIAAQTTRALGDFKHPLRRVNFEWDIATSLWTREHLNLFDGDRLHIVSHFHALFEGVKAKYDSLRKGFIHNDVNDNNIIVSQDPFTPSINGLIDFGDAVHTQVINDLAVVVAYAAMHKPDVLGAASKVISSYHEHFPLTEDELEILYCCVAMRLVISVTKSAINKNKEPNNHYLQISEKPAWELLQKWITINPRHAHLSFRVACGFSVVPNSERVLRYLKNLNLRPTALFPTLNKTEIQHLDLSVASSFLGTVQEHSDQKLFEYKAGRLESENPERIVAGGYLEPRLVYSTDSYKRLGNSGYESRTIHLGVDFWVLSQTPIHSVLDGTVRILHDNNYDKDYGPTLVLEHTIDGVTFYTLYGHLSRKTLSLLGVGQTVKKGDLIGYVGNAEENGGWVPHLHFQLMFDLLGNSENFPGVAFHSEIDFWKALCPSPWIMFNYRQPASLDTEKIEQLRKVVLGKSLSLSYDEPLHIVRGDNVWLIDTNGRRYLDTVNNVAHVGHENHRVVKAGQQQMAVLNTNSRYLHENITRFAENLLSTFPPELSVVHFVNSGSEANELALRMAEAATGSKEVIALEAGYHGNTGRCVDVSSYKFDGKGGKGAPDTTHIVPLPDTYRGQHRGIDSGSVYAHYVLEALQALQTEEKRIGAFIAESIISCGGQIELPDGYLKQSYEMVRRAGGVCIADEVQVGCGRVGQHFWGFKLHGVIPDIVTIGKPIGNGHPIAAVVCTEEIATRFANGMEYFNTFGGNPVSCAIGNEVLNVIKDLKLQENALNTGEYLKSELRRLQQHFPVIGDVRGQGLFLGFELVDQQLKPLPVQTAYLANRMKVLGILMSVDGKDNNVIKIKPPLTFSKANTDYLIELLTQVFLEDAMQL